MSEAVKVATASELAAVNRKVVDVEGVAIAVFRVGDDYYAIEDVCTHDGGPLAEQDPEGAEIECQRHGARFDLRTGKVLRLPAVEPVATFPVEVRGEDVYILFDD